ncbi:hypothetical protein V2J09_003631 [Rumex salicifolius]
MAPQTLGFAEEEETEKVEKGKQLTIIKTQGTGLCMRKNNCLMMIVFQFFANGKLSFNPERSE